MMNDASLLRLLHLCDSSLPIGGFSHSAGLETYVQQGVVFDKGTATEFITQQLSQNIHYTDAAILSLAFDAACNNDFETILGLDEICNAVKLPMEARLASNKLGARLLKIFGEGKVGIAWKYKLSIQAKDAVGHYCVTLALLASAMDINKEKILTGFYYHAASGFITNAVKLIPLGQHAGQEILISLFPLINELVEKSLTPDQEMIGACCAGFDIRCMEHEQLHSRLYMS